MELTAQSKTPSHLVTKTKVYELQPDGRKHKKEVLTVSIEAVEYLLNKLFDRYTVDLNKSEVINANGQHFALVTVTVTTYKDGKVAQMGDGIGCVQLFEHDSTYGFCTPETGMPIAKSVAIKDCVHLFGEIFGGSLNRTLNVPLEADKFLVMINACDTLDALVKVVDELTDEEREDGQVKMAISKKRVILQAKLNVQNQNQ